MLHFPTVSPKEGRKEGNVLFNDTLNTLYLWLYGIRHMVKDSEKGNLLCNYMGYSFQLAARDLLYAPSPQTVYIAHTVIHGLCYTSHRVLAERKNN